MSSSKLFINRFAVYAFGRYVYDQKFHLGVNIIRGENGTGKSTIMDLLNYVLGAETTDWTEEQLKCEYVISELSLNGYIVTLKRNITTTGQERVLLFDGDMDKAQSSEFGWEKFPMRRNKEVHSFSQHIFELLNLPLHQTDDSKNLTMHQILRLMYVDQLSATNKLLKEDTKYDNVTTRRAIGEYLLGIDTLEAYNLRQELISANRSFDKVNAELNAIYRMFGHDESLININTLNEEIYKIKEKIKKIKQKRDEVKITPVEDVSESVAERIEFLVNNITLLSDELEKIKSDRDSVYVELRETSAFLKSLEYRKQSLSKSKITNSSLGSISFKYCPSCLEPINENHDSFCCLCKSPQKNIGDKDYAYSQIFNELNFQIKESHKIIEKFTQEMDVFDSRIPLINQRLSSLKEELNIINISNDDKDAILQQLSTNIGFCYSEVLSLEGKREQVSKVELLKLEKRKIQECIISIQEQLEEVSVKQENRYISVYDSIELKAKELLMLDGGYEIAFDKPEDVIFDFSKDKMFVNGRSKFSASSMVVLKNSVRFSIFYHASDDKYARLPNLILMDNIEDKGMQEERSQNFQRNMVNVCETISDDYQLIYTTSMIAKELEGTTMCVGPFYPKGTHTLDFSSNIII
ncbi:ATP-binding protein [Photobacterium leiognathi]|uniref:ATP-binding protein n=1 Tax=Photobacterium leiognathi TaxID=553611 RepID=UPI002980E362|nr:ATP-binding protein [Photobacterium leiognathi]